MRRIYLSLVLAGIAVLVACSDKPNEPKPPKDKEYAFWLGEYDNNPHPGLYRYYRYLPLQDKFDTIDMPYATNEGFGSLALSADGTKLYLPKPNLGTVVVSADSMRYLETIPHSGHVAVSPDGERIAMANLGSLKVFDAQTHAIILQDTTVDLDQGSFDATGEVYAAVLEDSIDKIVLYDMPAESLTQVIELPHGVPMSVYPIDRGKRLLLSLAYRTFDWAFAIYDVALDSFLLWHYITPGHPEIAVSHNERHALVTNPGSLLVGPAPPSSFLVFDLQTNTLREEVDTRVVNPDTLWLGRMATQFVAITPDSKRAMVTGLMNAQFLIYNLETMQIERYHDYTFGPDFPRDRTIFNYMTCQPKP